MKVDFTNFSHVFPDQTAHILAIRLLRILRELSNSLDLTAAIIAHFVEKG
jgi:hypothetical protein